MIVCAEADRVDPALAGQVLDRLDGGDERFLGQLATICGGSLEALDQDVAQLAGDQDVAELTRLLGRVAIDRLATECLVVGDAGLGILTEVGCLAEAGRRQRLDACPLILV